MSRKDAGPLVTGADEDSTLVAALWKLPLPTVAPDTKAGSGLVQMHECQHTESPNHFLEQIFLGCLP